MVGNGLPLYLSIVSIRRSSCRRSIVPPSNPRTQARWPYFLVPDAHGVGELVQLHAAVALARPGVRQ